MLSRFRRKLSRTKSIVDQKDLECKGARDSPFQHSLSLSRSDEELISRIKTIEHAGDAHGLDVPDKALTHEHLLPITNNSERTVYNSTDVGMLSAPTEVLLNLQQHLTPSSEVALRHTCSRFYQLFSLPSFYLSGEEKFEWLCMNERDQNPRRLKKLVCGHCRDLHIKSSFPKAEIVRPPGERDCRQVWLCAHSSIGYKKAIQTIKAGVDAPFRSEYLEPCSRCRDCIRNRSIADRTDKGTAEHNLDSIHAQSLLISKIAIMQAPVPVYSGRTSSGSATYKDVFPVKDVAAALQAIDFPLCSHLRLGDPYILSRFCRSCLNTQKLPEGVRGPPCISQGKREWGEERYFGKCRQTCYTRGCKTKFMFQARESLAPDSSGQRQIWLIIAIYRWLGPLQSSGSDMTWRSHTSTNAVRMEMRLKWDKLEKSQRRRIMPNWSICSYNPEDCNLRN